MLQAVFCGIKLSVIIIPHLNFFCKGVISMDCMNPMLAVRSGDQFRFVGAVNGSTSAHRKYLYDTSGRYVVLPCGQCMACRLNKSRDWATRCVLEAKCYEKNCFITLTYNDENLPSDLSLKKEDFTLFIKRLRKNTGAKIRYFACGEYGSLYSRPHFHACLFGYCPDDLVLYANRGGCNLYISETIAKAWQGKGFITVGDVTFESAAYVARYVTKKITGSQADDHYQGIQPEYTVMSRRPGIAAPFFEKYSTDIYGKDFIVIRDNIKCKPPKYFDRIYDNYYGDGAFEEIKDNRIAKSFKKFSQSDVTEYSLKRIVNRARFKELSYKQRFSRSLEEEI